VYAVNGISFELLTGETLTIVGESGSGKTISMLALMRLIDPPGEVTRGQVILSGKDMYQRSPNELQQVRGSKIALISQDPDTALNPVLQVGLQVSEALVVHNELSKREAREKTIELLTMVGIPEPARYLDNYPHQLSGGMRQRVMIAVALACRPEILIADEPTTALDVTVQAEIIDLMLRLQKQFDMSVIWITHDLGVVARVAQRVLVMYAGMIVEEAQVKDLFTSPRHPYSIGLLNARPRVDGVEDERLYNIPGAPPVMVEEPKGCPFVPRCRYASGRCRLEMPPLIEVENRHYTACWEHRRFATDESAN
jgi:oligopeptide/dipeptide ABC transporter ATP-binding protein